MSSLFQYKSNRLKTLAEELARVLIAAADSPLRPELVIVPSLGLRRWLSLELARINGVCANVSFPFLADFIGSLPPEMATPNLPRQKIPPEEMIWAIHRVLPGVLDRKEFRAVRSYLSDSDPLKLVQLTERIAQLFDQYLVYRAEMVRGWESSKAGKTGDEAWQAVLWRELANDGAVAAARKTREEENTGTIDLPSRIFLFAPTMIPPVYLEALFQVAKTRPVHLFLLEPSSEYHGDDLTPKKRARRKISPSEPVTGNPLLTSLGRTSAHLTELLLDADERFGPLITEASEHFNAPAPTNLLSSLQSDILRAVSRDSGADEVGGRRSEVGGQISDVRRQRSDVRKDDQLRLQMSDVRSQRSEVTEGDRSLQIHSCHSPMREVEVLYDQLLHLFEKDPTLRPRDILVMTPDIEKYSPFIRAVFEYPEQSKRQIPYSISDRHPRSESAVIDSFLSLLELATRRCTAEEVFALISSPIIAQRFGFSEDDLSVIHTWIRDTGIRWGINADHRERVGLPATDANTWHFGFNRLLLGYAMRGKNRTLFEDVLPYDEVEGEGGEVLGRFLSTVKTTFNLIEQSQTARPLSEWALLLRESVDALLESEEEDYIRDLRFLRKTFSRLDTTATELGANQPVELVVVRHHLEQLLGKMEQRGGFLTGSVTFCALKPARSIPARVIFLLGMNDDVFPRRPQPAQFDLMANWRLGDPSPREDDRYAFLETICAAAESLQISYVGRSIVHNQAIPPSVVVSELLDYLDQAFVFPGAVGARKYLLVEHPLQAFSPRYFDSTRNDQRLFSYSDSNAAAATASANPTRLTVLPPFIVNQLPPLEPEQSDVQINQLISFLAAPQRFFLRTRFGIDLKELDDTLPEDEPIELDQLEKYCIRQELLTEWIDAGNTNLKVFTARGITAPGTIGQTQLRAFDCEAANFRSAVLSYLGDGRRSEPVAINLRLAEFSLNGQIDSIYAGKIVHYRCANLKPRDRLQAWVGHLAWSASCQGHLGKTILIGQDEMFTWEEIPSASELLSDLCQLYWQALQWPVPFFPKSGFAYVAAERTGVGNPSAQAKSQWHGDYKRKDGEKYDPSIELLFRDPDPLSDESLGLARGVFAPLLQHAARQATP